MEVCDVRSFGAWSSPAAFCLAVLFVGFIFRAEAQICILFRTASPHKLVGCGSRADRSCARQKDYDMLVAFVSKSIKDAMPSGDLVRRCSLLRPAPSTVEGQDDGPRPALPH